MIIKKNNKKYQTFNAKLFEIVALIRRFSIA